MSDAQYRGDSLAELTRAIALEADVLKRLDLVQARIELKARARDCRTLRRCGPGERPPRPPVVREP